MGDVIQFSKFGVSFDPETLKALGAAYDLVMVHSSHSLSERECEVVALRMIEAAKLGHRDVHSLYAAALSDLGGEVRERLKR
jgi:hypothetical protein